MGGFLMTMHMRLVSALGSKMRKIFATALAATSLAAICSLAPSANASTYDVHFSFSAFDGDNPSNSLGIITVTGTMVTTCDNCTLSGGGDIPSWSVSWDGLYSGSASGTGSNNGPTGPNPELVASGGEIQFVGGADTFWLFTDHLSTSQLGFGAFSQLCSPPPGLAPNCIQLQQSILGGHTDGLVLLPFTIATEVTTPLPAALPLFATGLGGLGLLGWRRKRKAQAIA
jgi:hypothetical protein